MDFNQQILEELKAIRRLLTIFSEDKLEEFNENIKMKYLTKEIYPRPRESGYCVR